MKNLKIFLLLALIFSSIEKKASGKKRKLDEYESDSTFESIDEYETGSTLESIDEIYDSTTDENFKSNVEINVGNYTQSDYDIISSSIQDEEMSTSIEDNTNKLEEKNSITIENNTNTDIFEDKKTTFIENYTFDIVNSSNIVKNYTEIDSTFIGNNTGIYDIPNHNTTTYFSKLILLGFGHYYRTIQKDFIYFIVYFYRILGNTPSRYLIIPINIDYSTRLRFLEENKVNCTRITDDDNVNIKYNCSVPVDPNKAISLLSIKGNNFIFGNGENVIYIFSSYSNQTKNNLLSQIDNDLDKGVIVIKDTILEKDNEKFLLIGNSSEIINDSKIILSLDSNENIINVDCNAKNLLVKLYEFECVPNKSINNHFNGVSGKTDSGHNLVIFFPDGKNDFVDIKINDTNFDNINNNFENAKVSSSSSGLSSGYCWNYYSRCSCFNWNGYYYCLLL